MQLEEEVFNHFIIYIHVHRILKEENVTIERLKQRYFHIVNFLKVWQIIVLIVVLLLLY